ncbi:hypothetical protein GIB67_037872 [Kingdonia uniflora]|uniref:Uncharacterized protein n=1 Tax=Kingdonia uniflora TaxID=39325 RepID=A0A7J7LHA7_9MAGN|nr:hypothetical protein GIB67_037872 [Kingdonia uniflora]
MFGVDNLCWISAKAASEASKCTEFLRNRDDSIGKSLLQNQTNLVPNVAKLEALRDEYMHFSVDTCSAVLMEYHSTVETITDILLEEGKIKANEIWKIYRSSPRTPQARVDSVDEYGALAYAGR